VFLGLSCAGFYRIAAKEFGELSRERKAAAKLAKSKGSQLATVPQARLLAT
jgi:hypothetical protein